MATPPATSSNYEPPSWASAPSSQEWKLLEIKSGQVLQEHFLASKACVLLGRAEDEVDIPLAHESCSRRHARIAFDSTGNCWLMDWQSTHGTTVNKKRLPAQACRKTESNNATTGSRGVMIRPGDVLQFGASTRLFVLEGPDESSKKPQPSVAAATTTRSAASASVSTQADGSDNSVRKDSGGTSAVMRSLGQLDAAVVDKDMGAALDQLVADHPQHQKDHEHIRALRYKLEQAQQEASRIERKGTLTEGQERQLERLVDRQEELQLAVQEKEQALYHKLHPNAALGRHDDDHDDDDEVQDLTQQKRRNEAQHAETEESLVAKREALRKQQEQLVDRLQPLKAKLSRLQHVLTTSMDDTDAFFQQNDINLVQEQIQTTEARFKDLEKELQETEALLRVVAPHRVLEDKKVDANGKEAAQRPEFQAPAPKKPRVVGPSQTSMLPPPPPPK